MGRKVSQCAVQLLLSGVTRVLFPSGYGNSGVNTSFSRLLVVGVCLLGFPMGAE